MTDDRRLRVHFYTSVTSTQDVCAQLVAKGEPLPFAVSAEHQSAGRGTHGRRWENPVRGVMTTLVVQGSREISHYEGLSLSLSVAIALLLEGKGLSPRLKWPNDIYLKNQKLAGLLVETRRLPTGVLALMVGFGMNVQAPKEGAFAALDASLRIPDTRALTQEVLETLLEAFNRFEASGFAENRPAWEQRATALGKSVKLCDNDGIVARGTFLGVDDFGRARIQTDAGIGIYASGSLVIDA